MKHKTNKLFNGTTEHIFINNWIIHIRKYMYQETFEKFKWFKNDTTMIWEGRLNKYINLFVIDPTNKMNIWLTKRSKWKPHMQMDPVEILLEDQI